jgi:glyoxylase-like metal-dependent hydrolase (beta-lactamase superfamily II)
VFAVKYAERDGHRSEHFLPTRGQVAPAGDDEHDRQLMPIDFFVWCVIGDEGVWVVDTGFRADEAARRGRRLLRSPSAALALVGVDAAAVTDVIITHLHYDHVGGLGEFPAARFHVQDREVAFATGRHMTDAAQQYAFTAGHIADFVLAVHAGRVVFHDGDAELAPGISVHHLGGHTDGLQVVRVHTARGWLVLASDAAHLYEHLETRRPFSVTFDVAATLAGFDRVCELADPPDHYVPGHDPEVLRRYPPVSAALTGIACRLG